MLPSTSTWFTTTMSISRTLVLLVVSLILQSKVNPTTASTATTDSTYDTSSGPGSDTTIVATTNVTTADVTTTGTTDSTYDTSSGPGSDTTIVATTNVTTTDVTDSNTTIVATDATTIITNINQTTSSSGSDTNIAAIGGGVIIGVALVLLVIGVVVFAVFTV
jgi:hypothetical protein